MSEIPPTDDTRSGDTFPDRRITLIVLSVLTLPYLLGLIVALFFAYVSPLVLVSGPAEAPLVAWAEALIFCTCPLTFVIGIAGGWLSFARQCYRLALILASLPVIETILIMIASLFIKDLY